MFTINFFFKFYVTLFQITAYFLQKKDELTFSAKWNNATIPDPQVGTRN